MKEDEGFLLIDALLTLSIITLLTLSLIPMLHLLSAKYEKSLEEVADFRQVYMHVKRGGEITRYGEQLCTQHICIQRK